MLNSFYKILKKSFSFALPVLGVVLLDSNPVPDSELSIFPIEHSQTGIAQIWDVAKDVLETIWTYQGFEPWRLVFALVGVCVAVGLFLFIRYCTTRFFIWALHFVIKSDKVSIFCEHMMPRIALFVGILACYIGFHPMVSPGGTGAVAVYWQIFVAIEVVVIAIGIYRVVNALFVFLRQQAAVAENTAREVFLVIFFTVLKIVVVCATVLYVGDRLGFDITALLAGAGVIGLAIAFASQDTVANVFGSVMIACDQPFKKGDFVKMDGVEGSVEQIGFRSTQLRNAEGHVITVPNKNCANAVIVNVTERPYARTTIDIGLVYQTTPEKMQEAIDILLDIVNNSEGQTPANPPRAGFFAFGDSAMTIRLVCWFSNLDADGTVLPMDFWKYFAWSGKVNMEILKRFNAAGLSFAYPTHVTYISPLDQTPIQIQTANR